MQSWYFRLKFNIKNLTIKQKKHFGKKRFFFQNIFYKIFFISPIDIRA